MTVPAVLAKLDAARGQQPPELAFLNVFRQRSRCSPGRRFCAPFFGGAYDSGESYLLIAVLAAAS